MLRPLRTRNELMELAIRFATSKACETAIKEDRCLNLGGFNFKPDLYGWIVRVIGKYGSVWNIAIIADAVGDRYRGRFLERVPWRKWAGSIGGKSLRDGDTPATAAFNRMMSRREKHANRKSA